MTQYGFFFDSSRCTGCRTCQMACKDYNDLSQTIAFRTVYDYEGGTWNVAQDGTATTDAFAYHVSVACNHCASPACVANCPQQSMAKEDDTGLVHNDPETCIACGSCVNACPYGAPVIDEEANLSVKCDGCSSRVHEGLAPICVEACPLRALEFGDIEELRAAHPDAVDSMAPLPDSSQTTPSLIIQACPAAKEVDDEIGAVANEKEVAGEPAREVGNGDPLAA